MRVACIGNMNNNFFSLARYLRLHGWDAELVLLENEFEHFHPSADTFQDEYQSYTCQVPWGAQRSWFSTSEQTIRESLKDYDALVVCDTVPAYLWKAGMVSDVFVPHGSDLFQYPFYRIGDIARLNWRSLVFSRAQRSGVSHARNIFFGELTENLNPYIERLHLGSRLVRNPMPLVYTPEFNPGAMSQYYDRSAWYRDFKAIRESHDIVVVHHARHIWNMRARFPWNQKRLELHYKSNDSLLRGFARFAKAHRDVRACIITFEYGGDVGSSKKLAAELGIEEQIKWFPKMPRKEIMVCLSIADIGTGEFFGGWSHAGVIFETLAMGKPLFHYVKDSGSGHEGASQGGIYPFTNVRTTDEIAGALEDYRRSPSSFQRMGAEGTVWFQRNIIDVGVAAYLRALGTPEP